MQTLRRHNDPTSSVWSRSWRQLGLNPPPPDTVHAILPTRLEPRHDVRRLVAKGAAGVPVHFDEPDRRSRTGCNDLGAVEHVQFRTFNVELHKIHRALHFGKKIIKPPPCDTD